jgi:hypothetical protein
MPMIIPYQIQASALVNDEVVFNGATMLNTWLRFNTNPDSRGLWALDISGNLLTQANQVGFSGLYSSDHTAYTNYTFSASVTANNEDDDSFGVHFRFKNVYNFYFLAWDRGGGIRSPELHLYKRIAGQNQKMAFISVGWVPGTTYEFKVQVQGNVIKCWVDNDLKFDVVDASSPHLSGAYGPMTFSQPGVRYHSVTGVDVSSFLLTGSFNSDSEIASTSNSSPTQLSSETAADLMQPLIDAYCTANDHDPLTVQVSVYTITTSDPGHRVYFYSMTMIATASAGSVYPQGHQIVQLYPPAAPTNLTGTLQSSLNDILWRWDDNSNNEDGFRILDKFGVLVATVGPNSVGWLQTGIAPLTEVCRRVVSYNSDGVSAGTSLVCITTPQILPTIPTALVGTPISISEIQWSWTDNSSNESGFRIFDDNDGLLASVPPGTTTWNETGLTPFTAYIRHIVSFNSAGQSNQTEGTATTLPVPSPDPVPPPVPGSFSGSAQSDEVIVWTWQMDDPVDGFRIYDEYDLLIAIVHASGRSYIERGLLSGTTYYRYIVAYNQDGDSPPSALVTVVTPETPEGEEDDWVCDPAIPVHFGERLDSFRSGVGDNLDLKAHRPPQETAPEPFSYGMQIQGTIEHEIDVYPRVEFDFRFTAEGDNHLPVNWGTFEGTIDAYPNLPYLGSVSGVATHPVSYEWTARALCAYRGAYVPADVSFIWTGHITYTVIATSVVHTTWSPTNAATVTEDFYDVATAKDLTLTNTLADIMQPHFEQSLLANGLTEVEVTIDEYTVTDNLSSVVAFTPESDGSAAVFAYTTDVGEWDWEPVTISIAAIADTITDANGTALTQKSVSVLTAAALLADEIAAYKLAEDILEEDFVVNSYDVLSDEVSVITATNADGSEVIKAYTTADTTYIDSQPLSGLIRMTDGIVEVWDPLATPLVLKNTLDVTYPGVSPLYSIENDSEVGISLQWSDETTISRADMISIVAESTITSATVISVTDEGITEFPAVTVPPGWTDIVLVATKTGPVGGEGDNTFAYFGSAPLVKAEDVDDEITSAILEPLFVGTHSRISIEPWTGTTGWFSAIVNGKQPLAVDGDGLLSYRSPLLMIVPETVIVDSYGAEILLGSVSPEEANEAPYTLSYQWDGSITETTVLADDVITFSCDYQDQVSRPTLWQGALISGGPAVATFGAATLIDERLPAPSTEASWQALVVKPLVYSLALTPGNPNVELVHVDSELLDWEPVGVDYLDVELSASVVNATQGGWHPRIHNGFYYLNNEEFFHYVSPQALGALHEVQREVSLQLIYTVSAEGTRNLPEVTTTFTHAEAPVGEELPFSAGKGVGIDDTEDYLTLITDGITGEYIGSTLLLEREGTWQRILLVVDALPAGAEVELYTRSFSGGAWSGWSAASYDGVEGDWEVFSPAGHRLEYRLVIKSGQETVPDDIIFTHDDEAGLTTGAILQNATWSAGLRLSNLAVVNGKATGPLLDLGDPSRIDAAFGTIETIQDLPVGTSCVVSTITADSPSGPWDGTGQPLSPVDGSDNITSLKKRYLRWVLSFTGTGAATPSVTSVVTTIERFDLQRNSPVIRSVSGGGEISASADPVSYEVSARTDVRADMEWHLISSDSMAQIIERYLGRSGISAEHLTLTYAVSTTDLLIDVTSDADGMISAQTLAEHSVPVMTREYIQVDVGGWADVSPVPQQGAPIVVLDSLSDVYGPLRQVHLTDSDGNPTLDVICLFDQGGRTYLLPDSDYDIDTLVVEINQAGENEWEVVPVYDLCVNRIRIPQDLDPGYQMRASYRIKRSFVVDYDFHGDSDIVRLTFHGIVPLSDDRVQVFCETAKDSAYRLTDEIELNPLKSLITTGFLYLTDTVAPTRKLEIHLNPNTIVANGYDLLPVYVRALDAIGNPVVGVTIKMSLTGEGSIRLIQDQTDANGLAFGMLTAPTLEQTLTVEVQTGDVHAEALVYVISEDAAATMSLETASLSISEGDSLLVTARILNQALDYETGNTVVFTTSHGFLVSPTISGPGVSSFTTKTNPDGEAQVLLKVFDDTLVEGQIIIINAEALTQDGQRITQAITLNFTEV